jgi:hypothetical protein
MRVELMWIKSRASARLATPSARAVSIASNLLLGVENIVGPTVSSSGLAEWRRPDQRSDILIPLKEADASNPAWRPWSFRTTPVEFCSCTTFAPPATAMLPETAV